MKGKDAEARSGAVKRRNPARLSPLPMEWMDPMSWRLPSGKALAEFALQAGFLAPLIMGAPIGTPRWKPRKSAPPAVVPPMISKRFEEGPDRSGTFRGTAD
jgi:hypothetical protein